MTTSVNQYPLIFVKPNNPVDAFIPDQPRSSDFAELIAYIQGIRDAREATRSAYSEEEWKKGYSKDKQEKFLHFLAEAGVDFVPQAGITGTLRSISLAPCMTEKSATLASKSPEEYLKNLREHPARLLIYIDSEIKLKTAAGEEGYCSVTYCINIFSGHMIFGEMLSTLSAAAKAGLQASPEFGTPITLRMAHRPGTGVDNRDREFATVVLAMGNPVFEPDCLSYKTPVSGIAPDFDLIRQNREKLAQMEPIFLERNPDANGEEVRNHLKARGAQLMRFEMDKVIGLIKEQSQTANPPAPTGFSRFQSSGSPNFSGQSRFAAVAASSPVVPVVAPVEAPVEAPTESKEAPTPVAVPNPGDLEDDIPF